MSEFERLFTVIDSKTGQEPDLWDLGKEYDLMAMDMEGFAITDDGSLIICDECGNFRYVDSRRFKVVWEGRSNGDE